MRFNRVFGYGIEVSNAHVAKVPDEYIRRQTLVGAERYVTVELKEYEGRVLGAEERMAKLELELFQEIRAAVAAEAPALLRTARAIGTLDALASLGEIAHERGYVRPQVDDGRTLDIVEGRHPVLESGGERPFTPNDLHLDPDREQVMILTGPNMSGKSVFMRQAALLVILAQMGGFVPARSARIGRGGPDPDPRRAPRTTSREARAPSSWRWSRRRASCTTPRNGAWFSSTKSGAAPRPSTASPSPGR